MKAKIPDLKERLKSRIKIDENGCWIWQGSKKENGYGNCGSGYPQQTSHRSAYQIFIGNIPDGLFVCHKCDVKLCCNPEHLFLGTNSENIKDAIKKGRIKCVPNKSKGSKGEKNPKSKLDNYKVKRIRELIAKGFSISDVCRYAKISPSQVDRISKYKAWRHI